MLAATLELVDYRPAVPGTPDDVAVFVLPSDLRLGYRLVDHADGLVRGHPLVVDEMIEVLAGLATGVDRERLAFWFLLASLVDYFRIQSMLLY